MPRRPRIVLPDVPCHVTQRGNYRQVVFKNNKDYRQYLFWINEYAQKNALEILTYCLMPNHVHFVCIPRNEQSLAKTFNTVHMRYSQYWNHRLKAKGHLWQGRFFSCLLDETHLYRAMRYVERNPVRAKLVKRPWDYPWSSARTHVREEGNGIVLSPRFKMMTPKQWQEFLTEEDEAMCRDIRLKTQRGLAVGSEGFIKKLEQSLRCSLACLNPGRPKRKEK